MGLFDSLFGNPNKGAADANRALYGNLQSLGSQYLQQGYDTGVENINKARESFSPLSDLGKKYGGATDLYLDALGTNGSAGNARATGAFQAGPGYEFALDQGLNALNRRRAAGGMLDSGNADLDAIKFGTGLADQTYGDWLSRLGGLVNPELSATSGAAVGTAGSFNDLASLAQNNAMNKVGLANQATAGQTSANSLEAQGEASSAKNLLGLGAGLLSLGTGGGATIGGTLLSGLGGMFKR
ncbi:hypothetical protein [Nitrobacter sp. TKz-YC02]|uniref:hypothetical protein n=1 Tax=Nitrobacter sp. TKz-YC02 TaxID=3398704 RepID=UPI003CF56D53